MTTSRVHLVGTPGHEWRTMEALVLEAGVQALSRVDMMTTSPGFTPANTIDADRPPISRVEAIERIAPACAAGSRPRARRRVGERSETGTDAGASHDPDDARGRLTETRWPTFAVIEVGIEVGRELVPVTVPAALLDAENEEPVDPGMETIPAHRDGS